MKHDNPARRDGRYIYTGKPVGWSVADSKNKWEGEGGGGVGAEARVNAHGQGEHLGWYRGFIARFTGPRRLYNCRGRRVGPFSRGNMAATRATLAGKSRYFGSRVRLLLVVVVVVVVVVVSLPSPCGKG